MTVDVNGPPSDTAYSTQSSYDSRASLVHPPLMQQQQQLPPPPPASMLMMAQGQPSQTLANPSLIESSSKRNTQLGHPLKSFTVPAPPPQSAPPVKIVSPNSSNNGHRQTSAVVNPMPPSPYKKALASAAAAAAISSPPPLHKGNGGSHNVRGGDLRPPEKLNSSYSTEELNQEMVTFLLLFLNF